MKMKLPFALFLIFIFANLFPLGCSKKIEILTLATTTSVENSGLLDVLLPPFEKENKVKIKVIAVGSGAAIRLAKEGNADIILVHDPDAEEKFITEGYGNKRYEVMYNDFILVGPESDPAKIKGGKDVTVAFKKIASTYSTFVSRGDDSGTYKREKKIWELVGIKPQGKWYLFSGSGMEETLRVATEKKAYTLTDRGTYLACKKNIDLSILVEGDSLLFNLYTIIPLSKKKLPWIKNELAMKLVNYISGKRGQEIIKTYGVKEFGQPLFFPKWTTKKSSQ